MDLVLIIDPSLPDRFLIKLNNRLQNLQVSLSSLNLDLPVERTEKEEYLIECIKIKTGYKKTKCRIGTFEGVRKNLNITDRQQQREFIKNTIRSLNQELDDELIFFLNKPEIFDAAVEFLSKEEVAKEVYVYAFTGLGLTPLSLISAKCGTIDIYVFKKKKVKYIDFPNVYENIITYGIDNFKLVKLFYIGPQTFESIKAFNDSYLQYQTNLTKILIPVNFLTPDHISDCKAMIDKHFYRHKTFNYLI